MEYYGTRIPSEYLSHHGVKGQQWGIKNGPPYPLGSDQKSAAEKKASGTVKVVKKEQSTEEKLKKIKDADLISEEQYWSEYKKDPKHYTWSGRLKRAADTGLKALNKSGRDGFDEKRGITDDDRFWFVCEDQTIGLVTIADLVNRGKSKSEIFKLIDYAVDLNKLTYDDTYGETVENTNGIFQLSYTDMYRRSKTPFFAEFLNNFIDECERNK